MTEHDDELLARLRAADPAATLPPADHESVHRLLEDTMSNDLQHESRETGARDRSPTTWLVAAAAVVIIAGVGFFGAARLGGSEPTPPSAGGDGSSVGSTDLTVTELAAPGQAAYAARCMVPNSEMLATQTIAFDGVVDDITDGLVTLTPTRFYAGPETDQVQVRAPSEALQALIGAVEFETGARYLVSARNGRVSVCGFTGPYRPELAALYEEAFPGVTSAGLLLAAGAGTRMGMPKALVREAAGEPWLVRGVQVLREGGCSNVSVVLGAGADEAAELLVGLDVTVVPAEDWADGMAASLRAGLASLADTAADAAVVSLVDLPDVTSEVVRRVLAAGAGRDTLARASYDGRPGHPVVIGRDHWAGVLEVSSGDRGARDYLASHPVERIECGDLASGHDVDSR